MVNIVMLNGRLAGIIRESIRPPWCSDCRDTCEKCVILTGITAVTAGYCHIKYSIVDMTLPLPSKYWMNH